MYFFFLQRLLLLFRFRHHVTDGFKHWLSISLEKESSKDVNVERCKRCVGSSRLGLEQIVDPVRDWVREASHGRRQARWRRRRKNEVVHERTDGEDNRVANGASPRLNRGQGQSTLLAIGFIDDAEVVFFYFIFFSSGFWQGEAVWLVCLSQLSDHLKVDSWWIASHFVRWGPKCFVFFFLFCVFCYRNQIILYLSLSF